jgi:hypothetical protein
MSEKHFPVYRPLTVDAPDKMVNCDYIEIKVSITPQRIMPADSRARAVTSLYSSVAITRLEARDSRALFHVTRQMIDALIREWFEQ